MGEGGEGPGDIELKVWSYRSISAWSVEAQMNSRKWISHFCVILHLYR